MIDLLLCVLLLATSVSAFVQTGSRLSTVGVAKPLYENFGFDFAEDGQGAQPGQLLGEENYIRFVETYDPEGLKVGGKKYSILGRVRELKLLSQTADSGLLEVLEAKGLTLSQVEKLLPYIDELNLLPLAVAQKDAILKLAPLLIEPAPALIPVAVSLLRNPALVQLPGALLVALGGYEVIEGNTFGAVAALLGLPLLAVGSILGSTVNIPTVKPGSLTPIAVVPNAETSGPSVKVGAAPKVSNTREMGGAQNAKRKTIKINRY